MLKVHWDMNLVGHGIKSCDAQRASQNIDHVPFKFISKWNFKSSLWPKALVSYSNQNFLLLSNFLHIFNYFSRTTGPIQSNLGKMFIDKSAKFIQIKEMGSNMYINDDFYRNNYSSFIKKKNRLYLLILQHEHRSELSLL